MNVQSLPRASESPEETLARWRSDPKGREIADMMERWASEWNSDRNDPPRQSITESLAQLLLLVYSVGHTDGAYPEPVKPCTVCGRIGSHVHATYKAP